MRVDLHLHTTASDGRLSPAELVQLAARIGLDIIAITDHDSIEGIVPALAAAQAFPHIKVIPGVEISTETLQGDIHILGYFINYQDPILQRKLVSRRNSRQERAQRIIAKLANLGIHIKWDRVLELAQEASVGRPHIAQVMLEAGYISSLKEAFAKYIGRNGPAYVKHQRLTPVEAIDLIVNADGLPVLAHPANIEDLGTFLHQLKKAGLVGIEAYYNGYLPQTVKWLVNVATEHGLIPSGGSDYHGLDDDTESKPGSVNVPIESVERLIALAQKKWLVPQ